MLSLLTAIVIQLANQKLKSDTVWRLSPVRFSTAGLHYSEMKIQDRAPPVELSGTEVN